VWHSATLHVDGADPWLLARLAEFGHVEVSPIGDREAA